MIARLFRKPGHPFVVVADSAMSPTRVPVNRTLVGVLAVVLTIAGIVVGIADSLDNIWCGSLLRTGVLLGALWLALPGKNRDAAWANVSPWALVGLVVLVIVFVRNPRAFIVVVFVMTLGAIFIRPKRR